MAYQSLENKIGMILIKKAGLKESDLNDVLSTQKDSGKRIGELLIDRKLLKPEDVAQALAFQLGLPYIDDLKPKEIDPKIVQGLTIAFCRDNNLLPISQDEHVLRVATIDPFRFEPVDILKMTFKKDIELVITNGETLQEAINIVFERSENLIQGLETEEDADPDALLNDTVDLLESSEDEAPVIRFVNTLLSKAVKDKASDIHIEPFEKYVTVRFRIDGILYDVYQAPKHLHAAISSRIKILAQLNIAEKRIPQDGRIKIKIAGREIDIRLSIVPVASGERLVMRLLDKTSVVLDLKTLGFSDDKINKINELTNRKYGIFLVTGPTGSGKSTTLSACLKNVCSPERNVITVEDPVEYQLPGVGQIAVNAKVGLTFANGLRAILRQDPDVVMVGEIRDQETAEIAINASLTGHLVLSTLHTNDAPSAITRLVDMGIEPFLVSSSIVGVLAQRLIRKVCLNCSELAQADDAMMKLIGLTHEELKTRFNTDKLVIRQIRGCTECRMTGYRGRNAIQELMPISDTIRSQILQRLDASTIRKQAMKEGMRSLRDSAVEKLIEGLTSVEEILRMTQLEG